MSWSFGLQSWSDAYGAQLPRVTALAEVRDAEIVDPTMRVESPYVLGMSLPYALAPAMEGLVVRTVGRAVDRLDFVPFSFRHEHRTRPVFFAPSWALVEAAQVTDGWRCSYDPEYEARIDALAARFDPTAEPLGDEGWAIASAAFEKRLFELAHAAFDAGAPVVVTLG